MLQLPEIGAAEPENAAIGGETLRVVQSAIDQLPEEFRTVFMLRGVEQLSIAETAAVLAIKPATVKTRFHRARRLLQAALQRRLEEIAGSVFAFKGQDCDRVVADVLRALQEH